MTPPSALAGTKDWGSLVHRRVRERAFWLIQAVVLLVTTIHLAVEVTGLQDRTDLGGLPYLPMVLHLVPVAYAGYVYGYEGSILTGLWSGMLALPNVLLWHADDFGWLTDLSFTVAVILLGVVVAVPVERERTQRRRAEQATRRAEAANRRVTLLHEIASTLVASASTDPLRAALDALVEGTGLRAAALVTARASATRVLAGSGLDHDRLAEVAGSSVSEDGIFVARLATASDPPVVLVAEPLAGQPVGDNDRAVLVAAANQFAVAVDNARLHDEDRARMRTYVQEVTRAQERERARIARDLHDVVAQDLVVVKRQLDEIALPEEPDGDGRIRDARELAATSLQRLRRFSRDLRPTILDDLGLVPALQWLIDEFPSATEAETRFEHTNGIPRLDAEIELALFRVTQEALRNATRHGEADHVTVRLAHRGNGIELTIEDDGRGFDVPDRLDALTRQGSLGLLGMRERIELVGGEFVVTSDPGHGTRVWAGLRVRPGPVHHARR